MELIKYLIKKYPLMLMLIAVFFLSSELLFTFTYYFVELSIGLLEVLHPGWNLNEYIICVLILIPLLLVVYFLSVSVIFELILRNTDSGFTYELLLKLKYSKVMQIIWIFALVIFCFQLLSIIPKGSHFLIILPCIILFIYWYLCDVWQKLDEIYQKNIFQKIIYYPLNFIYIIWNFLQIIQFIVKVKFKKLLFIRNYIAAVISKTQLLCFILVNVLCSGYVFIKLLDFCWFKIVKVYFMDIRGLFFIPFSALWGVYQIGRFFILPNIYNFMLDNTKSGAVHSFIFSLKNTKWCKYLVLLFALIADILLAIYLYRPPFYFSYGLLETFDNFDIYITVFMLFISITPIYLVLYLYWHVEKQSRLEKTEKFSH